MSISITMEKMGKVIKELYKNHLYTLTQWAS